jgi:hypothetical protein
LQPHRSETFKLLTDPDFVAKFRYVVGLYRQADVVGQQVTPSGSLKSERIRTTVLSIEGEGIASDGRLLGCERIQRERQR